MDFVSEEFVTIRMAEPLEEKYTTYIYIYGKGAYCLGIEDGVQIGTEQRLNSEISVLSLTDMTHLIYVYDAVKQLNKTVVGAFCLHADERGIKVVKQDTFVAIANALHVSTDELLVDVADHSFVGVSNELSKNISDLPKREQQRILDVVKIMIEK